MPLLQSVISVLRETWDFNLDRVRQLVVHLVETSLIVFGRVALFTQFRSRLCRHPLARFAEVYFHFCELRGLQRPRTFLILHGAFS